MIHAYIHIHIHALHYINVCNYIHCIARHSITLHYITLYHIILHCITLYHIILQTENTHCHPRVRAQLNVRMYVHFFMVRSARTIGCLDFRSKTHAKRLWSVMSSSSKVLCRNSACMILMSSDVLEMRNEPRGLHEWQFSLDAAWFSRAMLAYAL